MRKAFRSYGLLLWWQLLRMRREIIILTVVQMALAVGVIYGLSLLIPNIDQRSAAYLATGAPTLTLLLLGLNFVPQGVVQAKLTGQLAYLSTLPVPRLAAPAAEVSFWMLAQLPGTALAVVFASIRFGFALELNFLVIPAMLLVALSAASVGYAFAVLMEPRLAQQILSFIAIGILLFSPINFPADRMPEAMQVIHRVLPIQYMADVIRWSLTGLADTRIAPALMIVVAWCLAGIFLSWRVALRRA